MERIRFSPLWIFVWIIFATDILVESVNMDLPSRLGVIGHNPVTLECRYSMEPDERLQGLKWLKKRTNEPNFIEIISAGVDFYSGYTPYGESQELVNRTVVHVNQSMFAITFSQVKCSDEASYQCQVSYFQGSAARTYQKEIDFNLEAAPLKPSPMTLTPNKDIFNEYESVVFSCTANVGKPAGTFWWFVYHGNAKRNVTNDAVHHSPFPSNPQNTCTFVRRSTLTLNLTRADHDLEVRCQVYHPTQMSQSNLGSCSDSDLCQMSKKLVVHYPVRQGDIIAYSSPSGTDFQVQTSVTLTCSVTSNPPAAYIWEKRDGNTTFTGPVWTINDLIIANTGIYDCMATNNVSGIIYNVTKSVNVNVVETTTTSTTTMRPSTPTPSDGRTDKTTETAGDNTTTIIIIVVCVVLGVIILIAAVVVYFIMKRRKKNTEVEEPPEKPFNNHNNLSMYNTQPDLVSDEKKYSHNNSFDFKPDRDQDLAYADLKFDDVPRSRKPVALRENIDYAHVSMPSV